LVAASPRWASVVQNQTADCHKTLGNRQNDVMTNDFQQRLQKFFTTERTETTEADVTAEMADQ
jgi:hypothetical protein